jgi:CubicO group peptidase (beta-lactamase class C family)
MTTSHRPTVTLAASTRLLAAWPQSFSMRCAVVTCRDSRWRSLATTGCYTLRGYGFADLATYRTATPRTAYLWFSMSKIATATMAMAAAEAGQLDLDAPVREYVPGYPAGPVPIQPTVRQLLNHTAGTANPLPIRWVRRAGSPPPDPQEFLDRILARHGRPKYPIQICPWQTGSRRIPYYAA